MDLVRVLKEGKELYNIEFETGIEYQFRLLSMREFRLFDKFLKGGVKAPLFIYEEIFSLCFLGDISYLPKATPMGHILSTGELIYYMSGAQDSNQILFDIASQRKENPGDSIFEHMRAVIISAIPRYTLFDIDNLTEKEFIKCFVIAENILSKTNPNFQRLDLKEIYDNLNGIKEEKKPIVQKENVEQLEQALGHWKLEEARQLFEQQELEKQKLNKISLSKEELAALDRAKKGV